MRAARSRVLVHRGRLARKLYARLRHERAVSILRKFVLRNVQRKRYRAWLAAIVSVQTGELRRRADPCAPRRGLEGRGRAGGRAGEAPLARSCPWLCGTARTVPTFRGCACSGEGCVPQPAIRAHRARLAVTRLRRERAAIKIQATVRGWLARRKYQHQRHLIIRCQSYLRRRLARRELRRLRIEARDLNKYKEVRGEGRARTHGTAVGALAS